MSLKTEPVEIDGIKFETTQFPAMAAFRLMARLIKVIGPAMGVLKGATKDTTLESLAPALGAALSNVSPDEAQSIALEILKCTTAEVGGVLIGLTGQAPVDQVFSGRLSMLFKVLAHALKVNYGDFSEGSDPAAPQTPAPSAS